MGRLWRGLSACIGAEQDRFFYWVPVLFGAGIALYFALPAEPARLPLALLALAAVVVSAMWRRGLASLIVGGSVACAALGLFAAKVASDFVAAPILQRDLRSVAITGWVELVEPRAAGGERITLRTVSVGDLAPDAMPRRVRIRVPASAAPLAPGNAVSVTASLLPPAGPALPGAYDFARSAWFMGLGAVGSARASPEPASIDRPMPLSLRLWLPVERLRQQISRRITNALPGETGAIAAALVTGERGGITEATNQAYRDSGIFHILSISGLHMTIFAGAVYFAARLLLALVPALALRFEIKKWAAVAGLLGTFGYLLISGGTPPAVRSAVMLSVMFLAVLLDRPALALRNVALAALAILAVSPSSLIDVGFQMSFAAVVALVTGVEAWRDWRRRRVVDAEPRRRGAPGTVGAFLGTITLTTLIATAAVAPLAAYYFHKSTQYGVLANLVAVPICNLIVMPAALATLIALPIGFELWPLHVMGLGIDAMTWVAVQVAAIPGAVTLVPAISSTAFGLMMAGGLWLCLWGGRWRLIGLAPIAVGIVLAPLRETPDVLVGGGGTLIGVRGADARLAVLGTARSRFELERWLEHDADPRTPADVGTGRLIRCDAIGCSAKVRGNVVAVARHPAALAEDCRAARLIVWLGEGEPACVSDEAGASPTIITRASVQREGTHTVRTSRPSNWWDWASSKLPTGWLGAAGAVEEHTAKRQRSSLSVETVATWRGRRPWSEVRSTIRSDDY